MIKTKSKFTVKINTASSSPLYQQRFFGK